MKTKGMSQQLTALARSLGKRNFAYFMEQGTGKTWTTLADAERAFIGNKIDALFVVAPKGVHTNWVRREIPQHMDIEVIAVAWKGVSTKKAQAEIAALYKSIDRPVLRVFTMNIEAMNTPKGLEHALEFVRSFKTMMVVDESTRIKNPSAKRTEKVIEVGREAEARRILTGTPLTKAPTDLYSQFEFLKKGLLGTTSYRSFMSEYAVLLQPGDPKLLAIMRKIGGRGVPQVVAEDGQGNKLWKNLDRLSSMVAPHVYRVRKEECLDLPPKVYIQRPFEMTARQREVYDRLADDYHYFHLEEHDMSFAAIAARTKLKQVVSGFVNIEGEPYLIDATENPRIDLLREVVEDTEGSFIIWAMFEEEINQIKALMSDMGIEVVTYYGATSTKDREDAIDNFQAKRVRCFIGHAAAAGIGITLTAATTAIYYSCSYDNELRMQSEDRCHRIGTTQSVTYIDLVAENSIDEDTLRSLATKTKLADYVIDGKAPRN